LRCGDIKDIDDLSSREIIAKATAIENFTITGQRIDVYGICEKCGSEPKKAPSATVNSSRTSNP
jgi:Fe2+ or Zn2+ uptake regulation protein